MHAGWNFIARRVSGNGLVIWLANCFSALILTFAMLFVEAPFGDVPLSYKGWFVITATGLLHIAYYRLLGVAYNKGSISVVYPIARGMAVAFLPLILTFCGSEQLSVVGIVGISVILSGIVTIGVPSLLNSNGADLKIPVIIGFVIIGYSLSDREGANLMNPITYLWGMNLFYGPGQTFWMYKKYKGFFRKTMRRHIKEIVLIGVADPGAYLIILFCFTLGAASYIIAMREFSVVIASILGFVLLKEKFSKSKVIAIVLITLGMILMKLS